MKILITGAGGYIGSVAAHTFLQKGYTVVALDNFSRGYQTPIDLLQEQFGSDRVRFYQMDLKDDLSPLFDKEPDIAGVIHFAAYCSVDESMKHPERYFTNNTVNSLNLLTAMSKAEVARIVFSSTCAVYGEAQYMPVDEKHPTCPKNPYGESKHMVEKMIEWYGALKNFHYVILRYFNVCGASDEGEFGDSKYPSVHLVQNAVRGTLNIEPFSLTCPEVATPDKSPIRDYVNVVDLAEAHVKAFEHLVRGEENHIINIGTGTGNSVLDIIKQVEKVTGAHIPLKNTDAREGEYARMVASIEKAQKVLGWSPKRELHQSITSLVKWYKTHPNGWR